MFVAGELGQAFAEVFYRRMFHSRGNNMPVFRIGLQGGQNRRGITFRATASKDDFFRVGPDEFGHLGPRLFNGPSYHAAEGMH